jgi:hypothetical protein
VHVASAQRPIIAKGSQRLASNQNSGERSQCLDGIGQGKPSWGLRLVAAERQERLEPRNQQGIFEYSSLFSQTECATNVKPREETFGMLDEFCRYPWFSELQQTFAAWSILVYSFQIGEP